MKRLLVITALIMASMSCAHNSAVDKSKPVNIINADIDTVWENTLHALRVEAMTLEKTNENRYFTEATQYVPKTGRGLEWTQGPKISVKLTPESTSEGDQTKVKFKGVFNYFARNSVTPVALEDDESERYMDELINRISVRIKTLSESHGGE